MIYLYILLLGVVPGVKAKAWLRREIQLSELRWHAAGIERVLANVLPEDGFSDDDFRLVKGNLESLKAEIWALKNPDARQG